MFLLLIFLIICLPVIEIAIFIQVGDAIGLWPVVGLIVASTLIGAQLLRIEGRVAWTRFRAEIAAGRPPTRAAFDRAAVFAAGALLVIPGFLTDIFALLLMFPPTRSLIRRFMSRWWRGRTMGLRLRTYRYRTDTIEHGQAPTTQGEQEVKELGSGEEQSVLHRRSEIN
jgi:UPF0716 protein FxsA